MRNQPIYLKKGGQFTKSNESQQPARCSFGLTGMIAVLFTWMAYQAPCQAAFNIPTDSTPSPLTINGKTADPFTAKLLMFEEFGLQNYSSNSVSQTPTTLPQPIEDPADPSAVCRNGPDGEALDQFLKQDLNTTPT